MRVPRRIPRARDFSLVLPLVLASATLFFSASAACAQTFDSAGAVRLSARSVRPGETLEIRLSSPYPERDFEVFALSPSGEGFTIARGTTASAGDARIRVALIDDPSLAGVDIRLYAEIHLGEAGEGKGELVARSAPLFVQVLAGESSPSASSFESVSDRVPLVSEGVTGAELADLDDDGDADIVLLRAGDAGTSIGVLLNDGTGSFRADSTERIPAFDGAATSLALADVDRDSDIDLLVLTSGESDANVLLLNDGAGFFSAATDFPAKSSPGLHANGARFADLDGDGAVELFIANGVTGSHGAGEVLQRSELLRNDGRGHFALVEAFALDDIGNPESVHRGASAGDFDHDGDLDLFVFRRNFNGLLRNDGAGNLEDVSFLIPEADESTFGAAFEDVDLDGDLDIVLANTVFNPLAQTILVNAGGKQGGALGDFNAGEFPIPTEGQSPVRLGLHTRDIDGDGDVDIVFSTHELGGGEAPDLYINQGGLQGGRAGSFLRDTAYPAVPGIYPSIRSADLDGDGDLDQFAPSSGSTDPDLYPAASFVLVNRQIDGPNAPLAFRRADANGDHVHDLSDAVFILGYLFLGGDHPPCLRAADVDASGTVDITDSVALLNYLFLGGTPPRAPFPGLGESAAEESLDCGEVRFASGA